MALVRTGDCNHCGKCCLPPVIIEGPTIEKGEDRCRFYVDIINDKSYGHCLIYGRSGLVGSVKDRFGDTITKEQLVWFNQNCIDYPLAKDADGGYKPPPECSFGFKVVNDG